MNITAHAEQRMAERGVTRRDVARALRGRLDIIPSRKVTGVFIVNTSGPTLVVNNIGDILTAYWN